MQLFSIRRSNPDVAAADDADAGETWYVLPIGLARLAAAHVWTIGNNADRTVSEPNAEVAAR